MKKIFLFFSLLMIVALVGCKNTNQEEVPYEKANNKPDTTEIDETNQNHRDLVTEKNTKDDDAKEETTKITSDELKSFVPDGYEIKMWETGNLNRDKDENDVILILDKIVETEEEYPVGNDEVRPVLVLTRDAKGKLREVARNDNVALCSGCGGVFGDPLSGITIKRGYFSIEHYGGAGWRWTRIMTFKYSDKDKTWYLHKDGGVSYHTGNPDDMEEKVLSKKDFGTIKFENYNQNDMPL